MLFRISMSLPDGVDKIDTIGGVIEMLPVYFSCVRGQHPDSAASCSTSASCDPPT